MNQKLRLTIIILSFFSVFVFGYEQCFSQRKKVAIDKNKSNPKLLAQSNAPSKKIVETEFQINVEKLPQDFNGHNLKLLYDSLEKREKTKDKGEFETTEQYRQRIEQDNNKPLLGMININSTIAFVEDVNNLVSNIKNLYNADNKTMTYTLEGERSQNSEIKYSSSYLDKKNCFQIDLIVALSKDYVGTNGYGTKANVRQTISYIPSLVIENWNQGNWGEIQVNMPINVALTAKNQSRILFIGKLTKPLFSSGYMSSKPTIQQPRDSSWIYNYLHLNLEEIWIFNKETGEIYIKFKPQEKKLNSLSESRNTNQLKQNDIEKLIGQAQIYYKNGNDDEALSILRKILIDEPMSAEAYLLIGKIHLRRNDLEQATSSFKTALFWDNHLIDAYLGLSNIYLKRDDCLQAKNYILAALEVNSKNSDVLEMQRQIAKCNK